MRWNTGRQRTGPRAGDRGREAGSSLVEVLIGLLLLSVTLLGIVNTILHVSHQRVSSQELTYAFAACRDNLEQLRTLPLETVAALGNTPFDVPGPTSSGGFLAPLPDDADGLPGLIEVQVEGQTPLAVLYRVAVTVEWLGRRGARRLRLETLVGNRR